MPVNSQPQPSGRQNGLRSSHYIRLEQRLILHAWLNSMFGYETVSELLADFKDVAEGYDDSGRSFIFHRLIARGDKLKIPDIAISKYDDNIYLHLTGINLRRPSPISLRYFQHLAVLFSEFYLDWYFNRRSELLLSLNNFIKDKNSTLPSISQSQERFNESDLKKLAYWMATGSGKTLILHINYRQFLFYNNLPLDNILLITPNEGMSKQHMEEMALSSIPAKRFDLNQSGLMATVDNLVNVLEITKLVEEKRGGGVSVPVEAFEGNNLIFVDEGHKGTGGDVWRHYRDALGDTGFTFEYSATFGQALTAARNDQLTAEYGKAILFDYSYRYFHGDGFGKDFIILNLLDELEEAKTEFLLLGNLISFYEQQLVFAEKQESIRSYNLEKPLWVFVGSTVNAVYTEDGEKCSDVLTVLRFLARVLKNDGNWVIGAIDQLLNGNSGLVTQDGSDVFLGKFEHLKETGLNPNKLYQGLLEMVFHTSDSGIMHLYDIRGCDGELGLKASGSDNYFGLVYIGDTTAFKKLVVQDDSGIICEDDNLSNSLFDGINQSGTSIDILIGAKKFMEGWNSWRVSSMGLLNIGRSEGSEIIQLFGRGVRLKGKGLALKRSSALSGNHPRCLRVLEKLNIFAVRANYMTQFRDFLDKEGVEIDDHLEFPIPIVPNNELMNHGLVVPRVPSVSEFSTDEYLLLVPDPTITVTVDMSIKVEVHESGRDGIVLTDASTGIERHIPDQSLELVDWERVYLDVIAYKERRGYSNLVIEYDTPKTIITTRKPDRLYRLLADEPIVKPEAFSDRLFLHRAVINILKKYVDKFYRINHERWDTNNMVYQIISEEDPNLDFNKASNDIGAGNYILRINRSEIELLAAIDTLIDNVESLYQEETEELPRIYFDRHLYQPLLAEHGERVGINPPGLSQSEIKFVRDLREFWTIERDRFIGSVEVFLLRNLSRGHGIGFFEDRGFYPDFILWIKKDDEQSIVFVEPHGMFYSKPYIQDDKARLHEALPLLADSLGKRSNRSDVFLDSYIISATSYSDLQEIYDDGSWNLDKFQEAHILFFKRNDEYDYLDVIFTDQLSRFKK